MIDGNSRKNFDAAKNIAINQPELLQRLTEILVDASEEYLLAQIEAGAECLQIFDSWAGLLSGAAFTRFVIEPTRELVSRLKNKHPHIPVIGFPREAGEGYAPYVRQTGVDALSIDFNIDLDTARDTLQSVKPLQGNMDPALLVTGGAAMQKALETIMIKLGPKHIVNLGHGVVPQTPPEHVADMVSIVRHFRL
jgi:uroporphyrinogen decarboxylase